MKKIELEFADALISQADLQRQLKLLEIENKLMRENFKKKYDSVYASLYLSHDDQMLHQINQEVKRAQSLKPTVLVVVGIGGSNLGTEAIAQALFGFLPNETNKLNVYYADTVDSDNIGQIKWCVEEELKRENQIYLVVVTKSGATTETIANFEIFLEVLMRYRTKNYHEYVTIITDENSPLALIAQQKKFSVLYIPKLVGGRFSVFSAVGLFPLGLMGVDVHSLFAGARSAIDEMLAIENNSAAVSAAVKFWYWQKKQIYINDLFLFSVSLEGVGKWYRQLVGESLGKEHDRDGKIVRVGIVPTVSIGSIDLHSVGQLYLGGPRNFFTTFVTVEKNKTEIDVPKFDEFDSCVKNIQKKSLLHIMNAIILGVKEAYKKEQLPFCSITLPERSPFYVGQLLQYAMLEIMYLGNLLNINAFDQPHVELYKKETRKILADE